MQNENVKPAAHVRKELSNLPREAFCSALSSRVRQALGKRILHCKGSRKKLFKVGKKSCILGGRGKIRYLSRKSPPPPSPLLHNWEYGDRFIFNDLRTSHSIEGRSITEGQRIYIYRELGCVSLRNRLPFPQTLSLPEVSSIILNSPYNFNTLSSRQVITINGEINKGIVFCSDTKLSGKANKDMKITWAKLLGH